MAIAQRTKKRSTEPGSTDSGDRTVRFQGVVKDFRDPDGREFRAVDTIDLTVPSGQILCILGPSGHGKSTLVNLLAGFIPPTSGSISVGDRAVTGPGADRGVVFQRDTLLGWRRVADNLTFGLELRGEKKVERARVAHRLLERIGLEGRGKHWPKQLSGGMRRRVAIAAVLANAPEVLIMDEPFTGLDSVRRRELYTVLLELWDAERPTVICVTHDLDEALTLGDRVVVIVHGRVALDRSIDVQRPRTAEDLSSTKMSRLRFEVMQELEKGLVRAEQP